MTAGTAGLVEEVDSLYALTPEVLADPYPVYHRMRAEAPVLIHAGVAAVTRYADVEAIMRNLDDYSNGRGKGSRTEIVAGRLPAAQAARMQAALDFMDHWVVRLDPPDHTRVRALAHRAFTPRRVAEMTRLVQTIADELLDQAAEKGDFDLIDDYAYQLPLFVIGDMLGVPREDRKLIRRWSEVIATFTGTEYSNIDEMHQTVGDFRAYLHDMIVERRRTRQTDLLAALLEPDEAGDRLSREELEGMFMVLLFAGHETTTNLIGNSIHALLRQPDKLRELLDDLFLVPLATEEFLRYETPVHAVHRTARATTTVSGTTIPEGTTIRLLMGAANRDPDRFAEPDRLDLHRDPRHLAFGIGPHFCLGQALTRLEGPIAIESLLRRFPGIEPAGPMRWRRNLTLHGLEIFPVRVA
jgi:cytochrome P450